MSILGSLEKYINFFTLKKRLFLVQENQTKSELHEKQGECEGRGRDSNHAPRADKLGHFSGYLPNIFSPI